MLRWKEFGHFLIKILVSKEKSTSTLGPKSPSGAVVLSVFAVSLRYFTPSNPQGSDSRTAKFGLHPFARRQNALY